MDLPYQALTKWAVGSLAVVSVCAGIYVFGYTKGSNAVKAERAQDVAEQKIVIARLEGQIAQKEKDHAVQATQFQTELVHQSQEYNDALTRARFEFTSGLRLSEQRADRYRSLSESGSTQCRGLASYAAQLDRSIVEGQSVVKELRATLELRDSQLVVLGKQILSDRQLYENNGTDRN